VHETAVAGKLRLGLAARDAQLERAHSCPQVAVGRWEAYPILLGIVVDRRRLVGRHEKQARDTERAQPLDLAAVPGPPHEHDRAIGHLVHAPLRTRTRSRRETS